jgi:HK97 family phage prohead protease
MTDDLLRRELDGRQPTCRRGDGFADNLTTDGASLQGRAVPYGQTVELRPGLWERFERGVFARQVKDTKRIKLCLEHNQVVGHVVALEERDDGLYFDARISENPSIPEAARARALVAEGLIDELSVGFQTVAGGTSVDTREDGTAIYTHRRARLMEISAVPWGAYGREATLQRSRLVDPTAMVIDQQREMARRWLRTFRDTPPGGTVRP